MSKFYINLVRKVSSYNNLISICVFIPIIFLNVNSLTSEF